MSDRRHAAEGICRTLADAGFRALLAGGCVRDILLGVAPKDYDIATDARPEQIRTLFDKTIDVGAAFGVIVVVLSEGAFEVATFRRDGPYLDGRHPTHVTFVAEKEDALRRDFTINAMFLDPATDTVVDYVHGQEDLRRRVVRAVGVPQQRFSEDYLRMLRAVRFAARLDYAIAPETCETIREMAPLVRKTSPERVREELVKILTQGGARKAFELLDETRLLQVLLPEVARMKGVRQPEEFHPEGDVFTHTLLMLDLLDESRGKTGREPPATLAFGVLLHDVGKPLTQTFADRIRFNDHDKVGADETARICRRLRIPRQDTARIVWLVRNHMRVAAAPKMRESKLKRFVREEGFAELLELCRLDCLASHRSLAAVEWLEDYLTRTPAPQLAPEPLLTGKDLIAMGYEPGPLFAEILHALEDAQLEGVIANAKEAREIVRANWPIGPT